MARCRHQILRPWWRTIMLIFPIIMGAFCVTSALEEQQCIPKGQLCSNKQSEEGLPTKKCCVGLVCLDNGTLNVPTCVSPFHPPPPVAPSAVQITYGSPNASPVSSPVVVTVVSSSTSSSSHLKILSKQDKYRFKKTSIKKAADNIDTTKTVIRGSKQGFKISSLPAAVQNDQSGGGGFAVRLQSSSQHQNVRYRSTRVAKGNE